MDETLNPIFGPSPLDPLDAVLHRALGSYTAGEPSPGLAARIVAALPPAAPRSSPRARIWAVAAAAGWLAATATLVLWIRLQPSPGAVFVRPAPAPGLAVAPVPATAAAEPPALAPPRSRTAHTPSLSDESFRSITFAPIELAPIRFGAAQQERP